MPSLKYVFTSDSDSDDPQPLSRPQFSSDSSDSSDSDLQQPLTPSKCSPDSEVDQSISWSKCSSGSSDSDSDSSDSDSDSEVEEPLSQRKCSSDSSDQPLSRPKSPSDLQFSMKPSSTSKASAPPHNWSEEEQITLLKGLIDFDSHQEKLNVRLDPSIFDDYIQKKLNHLQLCQINEGITKLTLKFMATMDNEKPPPQDDLVFQLSKQLWGGEYYIYQSMKNPFRDPGEVELHSKYPMLAADFHNYYLRLILRNIKLIPEKKLRNIDKKLDKLQSKEDHVRRKFIWDNYRWLRQLDKKRK